MDFIRKRGEFPRKYPLPIIRDYYIDNYGNKDPYWDVVEGSLREDCVLVHDDVGIKLLFSQGFFGKGTLSEYAPEICLDDSDYDDPIIELIDVESEEGEQDSKEQDSKEQDSKEQDSKEQDSKEQDSKEQDSKEQDSKGKTKVIEEIVLSDSSSSDTERDFFPVHNIVPDELVDKENLQLSFEEAYFLSYALGSLVVKDKRNQFIPLMRLWNIFCELTPNGNFPAMYAAYHHFRSKGWVVKNGLKYGVDYLLYKDGPAFFHASYSVVVKPVNFQSPERPDKTTWGSLLSLLKLNARPGKELLFYYITKPSENFSEELLHTPECIKYFEIRAVKYDLLIPLGSREEEEEKEEED